MPLIERYEFFATRYLWGEDGDDAQRNARKKFREMLLGSDVIAGVTERYSELQIMKEVGYAEWNKLSLEEQGEIIAFQRLENMVNIIREGDRLRKDLAEQEKRKAKDDQ